MVLQYNKDKSFRLLFPFDLVVKKGTQVETDNKDEQKRLKELGFKEVKENKQKEGEK